ncbi:hypothetical protein D3C72_855150 [compost metagenome]
MRERGLVTQLRPELLGHVRREGREQQNEGLEALTRELVRLVGLVDEDHHLADGGVEAQALDVVGDLLDGLVQRAGELGVVMPADGRVEGALLGHEQAPHALQEAVGAFHALGVPGLGGVERPHEHLVETQRVRAVLRDDVVGVDHVAAGFGHLLAVLTQDHALVEELLEGLGRGDVAEVVEYLVPEAGVQEVHDRVLRAADVQVDGQPALLGLLAHELLVVVRIHEAQVVPATAGPLGHGVGLAARRQAGLGIGGVDPLRRIGERALTGARRLDLVHLGQGQGQGALGEGLDGAVFEVDDRNRLAPVALAAEDPVAHAVGDLLGADALSFQPGVHLGDRLGLAQPVEEARVDVRAVALEGALFHVAAFEHRLHRQAEGLGELPVTLVMPGHGHDGARAVGGEHVVRDPDRNFLAVGRVHGHGAGERAGLLLGEIRAVQVALERGLLLVSRDGGLLGLGGDLVDERVLGGQNRVGRAEERVRAGGEDREAVLGAGDLEGHLGAFRAADPVALHLLDVLGPVEVVEAVEELLGVGGDLEDPLAHGLAHDGVAAALALAVDDLLVGQDRLELGAPVDHHLRLVGQSGLVELQENPLGPLEVARVGGADLAVPVVAEAQGLDLAAEVVLVALGDDRRLLTGGDRRLLGGQAEGVPAHRVQHVEPAHALVARDDVRGRVAFRVADVQTGARRIREHVQDVELGLVRVLAGLEGLVFLPVTLPLGFDLLGIVLGHGVTSKRVRRPHSTNFTRLRATAASGKNGSPCRP